MFRSLTMASLLVVLIASPAMAQRLSERMENVRQQRAEQQREQETRELTVRARLTQMVDRVEHDNVPLREAVAEWSERTGIPVVANWEAMMMDGVDADAPVTLNLQRVPANQLLGILLRQGSPDEELIAETTPWYIEITTRRQANQRMVVRVYDIMDILHPVPQFNDAPAFDLESALDDQGQSGRGGRGGRGGSGRSGGGGRGGSGGGIFGGDGRNGDRDDVEIPTRAEQAEEVIEMIQMTVEPDVWAETGFGEASIRYYNGHLIINAPNYVHRQIGPPMNIRPRPSLRGGARSGGEVSRANAPLTGDRARPARGVAGVE